MIDLEEYLRCAVLIGAGATAITDIAVEQHTEKADQRMRGNCMAEN